MNALLRAIEDEVEDPFEVVHRRLVQWGRDKFYPGWAEPSPSAVLGRLMDERGDKRLNRRFLTRAIGRIAARLAASRVVPCTETRGVRMEAFVYGGDTVMCAPDGGQLANFMSVNKAVERSTECRQVGELLDKMQDEKPEFWHLVRVTYRDVTIPKEIPVGRVKAAAQLKLSVHHYRQRQRQAQAWLGLRLFPRWTEAYSNELLAREKKPA